MGPKPAHRTEHTRTCSAERTALKGSRRPNRGMNFCNKPYPKPDNLLLDFSLREPGILCCLGQFVLSFCLFANEKSLTDTVLETDQVWASFISLSGTVSHQPRFLPRHPVPSLCPQGSMPTPDPGLHWLLTYASPQHHLPLLSYFYSTSPNGNS